jgi:hypothetical protein
MNLTVIDNFFPEEIISTLLEEVNGYHWKFTRMDGNQDIYWTRQVYGVDYLINGAINTDKFTDTTVEKCWDYFRNKFNIKHEQLESCYLNSLTYGIEAHQHTDSVSDDAVTVICYVCHSWNSHWSGETSFYSGEFVQNPSDNLFYKHDVLKTVLPRRNRIVMFDSNIIHGVHPLSKSFKGLRTTLMFKLKNTHFKNLIQNAT